MAAGRPAIKRLSKPKIRASQAQPSRRGGRRTKSHTPRPAASVATTPAAARSSVSPQQQVQRSYGALLSSRDPIISDVGPLIPLPNFSNDPRLLEEIERINQLRSKNLSLEESEDEQEERCGSQNSLATVALLEFEGGFRAREKMGELRIEVGRTGSSNVSLTPICLAQPSPFSFIAPSRSATTRTGRYMQSAWLRKACLLTFSVYAVPQRLHD